MRIANIHTTGIGRLYHWHQMQALGPHWILRLALLRERLSARYIEKTCFSYSTVEGRC